MGFLAGFDDLIFFCVYVVGVKGLAGSLIWNVVFLKNSA